MKKILFWTLSFCICLSAFASPGADSLRATLPQLHGVDRYDALLSLARAYAVDSFDLSIEYAVKARELAEKLDNPSGIANAFLMEGRLWESYSPDLPGVRKAILPFQLARTKCVEIQDTLCMAQASFSIARLYARFELIDKAAPHFFEAIEYFRILGDTSGMIAANLSLAQVYRMNEEPEQEIFYSAEALRLSELAGMDSMRALMMFNVGEGHFDRKEYQIALSYFEEAISYMDQMSYDGYKALILNRTGETYCRQGKLKEALNLHQKALRWSKDHDDYYGIADSYTCLGGYFAAQKDYQQAIAYLDSSTFICKKIDFKSQLLKNYREYIAAYLRLNDYENLLNYLNLLESLRDSIDKDKKQKALMKVQTYYENDKKDKELEHNRTTIALKNLELQNSRIQVQFAVVAGLFLSILLGIFFFQYQNKKRVSNELEKKVAFRTRELRDAYGEVVLLNEELDAFAYRTAHDIRGPLARLLGLSQLAIASESENEKANFMELIQKEAVTMDNMLHRFLEVNNIKQISPVGESTDLGQLIKDMWDSLSGVDGFDEISIQFTFPERRKVYASSELLGIIIRNILENAIVFRNTEARVRPYVRIDVTETREHWKVRIMDNGIGIRQEVAPRIFEMFYRGTTASTSLGLGLYATRLAADKIGASISYHPDNRTWTEFEILVPKETTYPEKM